MRLQKRLIFTSGGEGKQPMTNQETDGKSGHVYIYHNPGGLAPTSV